MLNTTALMTDRYELTMLQAARHSGTADRNCVFEVFTRHLPNGRRYGVVAGTGRLLEQIQNFRFDESTLNWLAAEKVVDADTIDWLADYKFTGNISGYREGELYFAHSPVLTVETTFAEGVLLETLILSILNYDSAVASAASRMVSAANGRFLAEMGSRRVNENSAVAAARAAYIAGFDASSNLEAGRSFGVPTMGTSAHAFTLLHDSEEQAFKAQLETFGEKTTLLVDTYDIETAVRKAISLAPNLGAVRIDSGDLGVEVKRVRQLLDELGATETKITVTNDLDEFAIAALAAAPVDSYGVGTSVATGSGSSTAGFVYKLVSHQNADGTWVDVAKTSAMKTNQGGKKFAARTETAEIISTEVIDEGRNLLVELVANGEIKREFVGNTGVAIARAHHQIAKAELPLSGLRLMRGDAALPSITR
ncbi:MAG: nicotinate phosphoribosyltransferase [Micrococcales bacterium]